MMAIRSFAPVGRKDVASLAVLLLGLFLTAWTLPLRADSVPAPPAASTAPAPPGTAGASTGSAGDEPGTGTGATSAVLQDPRFDFELTLSGEGGAVVCVVIPDDAADPAACRGLNVAAVRSAIRAGTSNAIGVAFVRFTDWAVLASVSYVDGTPGVWTDTAMDQFVRGARDSLHETNPAIVLHGTSPGSTHDAVDVNGHRVLRYFVETPYPEGDARLATSRQANHALTTDGAILTVSFMADPVHEAQMRRIAETTMKSLRLRPPPAGARFEPDYRAVGESAGRLFGYVALLAALVVGIVVLVRSTSKRKQ